MSEIKTLADQLRSKIANPDKPPKTEKLKLAKPPEIPPIIELLRAYDVTNHKTLIHARVDAKTAKLIHHLKTATGIEVTRLICYAIRELFDRHPELKAVIRAHLENFEI